MKTFFSQFKLLSTKCRRSTERMVATNHKRDEAQKTVSAAVRILADETVEQILYRGSPRKLPSFPLFLGRSLAAVYNVNERSLHVGPPLLERIRETSISLRWNARKEEEEKGGNNRGPPSPLYH